MNQASAFNGAQLVDGDGIVVVGLGWLVEGKVPNGDRNEDSSHNNDRNDNADNQADAHTSTGAWLRRGPGSGGGTNERVQDLSAGRELRVAGGLQGGSSEQSKQAEEYSVNIRTRRQWRWQWIECPRRCPEQPPAQGQQHTHEANARDAHQHWRCQMDQL
jgi:hypothetical protein